MCSKVFSVLKYMTDYNMYQKHLIDTYSRSDIKHVLLDISKYILLSDSLTQQP